MSDQNAKWTSCFNSKFEEFIKDLIDTFPDDSYFLMCKQSFNLIKIVDENKPMEMFKTYALIYRDQIMVKDEQFFLVHDFEEIEGIKEMESSSNFASILGKLKIHWGSLNTINKDIIWKYLILLYKINDKICI
jgi:hypothetical protein